MQAVWRAIDGALGLDAEARQLTMGQMGLRTLVIFAVGIVIVRLAHNRFPGKSTAFDALQAVILGSLLGRAINGSAPFFQTIGSGVILVALHRLLAFLAFHSEHVGTLVKGGESAAPHGRFALEVI